MNRIDVLPDEVLLQTFYFYVNMDLSDFGIEAWLSLIRVCRRWRSLVLASPRHLNLRLVCTPQTKDTLDIWPTIPLIVRGTLALSSTGNVIAVFGQSNRVCEVQLLDLVGQQLEEVLAAMQVPFPELTNLQLRLEPSDDETPPVIPDSFLNGSAPRLRSFDLDNAPFPGLPKLLLSATHLVFLGLSNIPRSGFISPEAMVALLSVLSSLDTLSLGFKSPESFPDWESPSQPPPERFILPALIEFYFGGIAEYLEDFVAFIDAPQLHYMNIIFFSQISFDCSRFAQFINRTPILTLVNEAHVQFDDTTASIKLLFETFKYDDLQMNILCEGLDLQLRSLAEVCDSSLPPHSLAKVVNLHIECKYRGEVWVHDDTDDVENTLWLELLLPFTAVKNLYLSKEFAPDIAAALQELVGPRITEMLPSLRNIFVEGLHVEPSGPLQENIWQFAGARRRSGHPIAIFVWDRSRIRM